MDDFIDLTVDRGPARGEFSDEEDEAAFSSNWSLYKRKVWKLRHNDRNYRLVSFHADELQEDVTCSRVGNYLWTSTHVKNLDLKCCNLTDEKMRRLFGSITQQNATNRYLMKRNILEDLGVNEPTLVDNILDSLTSFRNLTDINVSRNGFGTEGLDVLVKALQGSPIKNLDISRCNVSSIFPLQGLQCPMLKKLDISGTILRIDDSYTITFLMGKDFSMLRELNLHSCSITDDFIERISIALSKNKSLRYLHMGHLYDSNHFFRGKNNNIGARGEMALVKAVHDSSSFENTLRSNHTIWKIVYNGGSGEIFNACYPNYVNFGNRNITPTSIALSKYASHVARSDSFDITPFTEIDARLIPRIFAKMTSGRLYYDKKIACAGIYKILRNKVVGERIATARTIHNLQSMNRQLTSSNIQLNEEVANLKQKLADLMLANARQANEQPPHDSIASRVKRKRSNSRKARRT